MAARLRYNGLTAALGGTGLTNVATSVTFAAALTHSNGTAVPTITAPNFIPLAILGATGHLSEIVYLTAYTAGATTGTITRGQEGTTGAVHAAGDTVIQAPLVGDAEQSERLVWVAGRYYAPNRYSTSTTSAITANRLYFVQMVFPQTRTIDRIGMQVTTAGTSTHVARLGIYNSDPVTYLPTTVLLDAGTLLVDTIGGKEATVSQVIPAGLVWLAFIAQSGSFTSWSNSILPNVAGHSSLTSWGATACLGLDTSLATAALPNMTGVTPSYGPTSTPPAVAVRAV